MDECALCGRVRLDSPITLLFSNAGQFGAVEGHAANAPRDARRIDVNAYAVRKKCVSREDSSLPGLTLRAVEINYRCLARHVLARVQWAAISGLDTRLTWVTG